MDLQRIRELRAELDAEQISYGELAEIESAFEELDPATLRDRPENAMAGDMLDELESAFVREYEAAVESLTRTQRKALDALHKHGWQEPVSSGRYGYRADGRTIQFSEKTLRTLADKGLATWVDHKWMPDYEGNVVLIRSHIIPTNGV